MARRAGILIPEREPYGGQRICAILQGLGYRCMYRALTEPEPGDVLVTWNRHHQKEAEIIRHEQAGATIVVLENGYFGRNHGGGRWYALAKDQHNGAGRWPDGSAERWAALGIELQPWKTDGEEIVVLASRHMGSRRCREPNGWSEQIAKELRKRTDRPVRVRPHPGAQRDQPAPEPDLGNAWCAVTWGSSAGLRALVQGVPVFHGFPEWIGKGAALPVDADIEKPLRGDRLPMFHRVASAMWRKDELAEGFRCLLT